MNAKNASSPEGSKRLAEDIFVTAGNEISCREASPLIGLVADLNLSDAEAKLRYPNLFQHLHFCSDCITEYRLVLDYARLEASGQTHRPHRIPPVPAEFSRTESRGKLGSAMRAIFPGFVPLAAASALRGSNDDRWQATIDLYPPVRLAIQAERSSADRDLRTLHFIIEGAQAAEVGVGESGAAKPLIFLLTDGAVEHEAILAQDHTATLLDVLPNAYELRVQFAGKEYFVEKFEVL